MAKTMTKKNVKEKHADFKELMEELVGEKIAIIAARYQYWGVLSEVTADAIVMSQAVAVPRSGTASGKKAEVVDPIPNSIFIKSDAIEIMYQPAWVNNPLPGTE